jgi:hypothetical protein
MKTTLLILIIALGSIATYASEPTFTGASQRLNAEKGTAIGLGKSKSQAASRARRNIPDGARAVGAVKYVKNADGTYTAYLNWKK